MNQRTSICFSCLVLVFALLVLSCAGTGLQRKTIQLAGGQEVPDLRGNWQVDYEYYGIYRALTGYCTTVKIFQDENRFMAVSAVSDQVSKMGTPLAKGELLEGAFNGFKTVQIFTKDKGWLDCGGTISDNGNKIVLVEATQTRTFTRKR